MGDVETELYRRGGQGFDGATALARKILKGGGKKLFRDCYLYNGQRYWIVNGRVLTRSESERLEVERQREGRVYHPSDRREDQG